MCVDGEVFDAVAEVAMMFGLCIGSVLEEGGVGPLLRRSTVVVAATVGVSASSPGWARGFRRRSHRCGFGLYGRSDDV